MIVTNPKLHHDWRRDWEGTHVRRVGNNWRITLCMRYKKKARGEVLEHMVLRGIGNLVISLTYRLYGKRKSNSLGTIPEVQCGQLSETFIVLSICRQKDTQEGRHRRVMELDRTLLPVHLSIFHLKDAEKRCSKALQPEITEKSGNLTEATANTGTNGGY